MGTGGREIGGHIPALSCPRCWVTVTRVCEMILNFAGHFDRQTMAMGPSPYIFRFRQTFRVKRKRKPSQDIFNIQIQKENLPLRRTFENFAGHVR